MRCCFVHVLILLVGLGDVFAQEIPCAPVEANAIQLDGLLGDWQGVEGVAVEQESALLNGKKEWSGPLDLSFELYCNHDEKNLYLAINVKDEYFIRTPQAKGDDHLEILFRGKSLMVYPGNLRGIPARVTWGRKGKAKGIAMAEAMQTKGYSVELRIPLKVVPGYRPGVPSFPAAVWVADSDSKAKMKTQTLMGTALSATKGTISFAQAKVDLAGFLKDKGYTPHQVRATIPADVVGDRTQEQVVLVGRTIGIIGEGLPGGNYLYLDLPVKQSSDIAWVKIMDLNGDGKMEIVTRYTERSGNGRRDLLAVFRFNMGNAFIRSFTHEILKGQGKNLVINRFSFLKRGRKGRKPGGVDLIFDKPQAQGFTQESFREEPSPDCFSILLPWEEPKKRHFRFEGDEFFQP